MLAEAYRVVCRTHAFAPYCNVVHTVLLCYTFIVHMEMLMLIRCLRQSARIDNAASIITKHHACKTE